MFLPGIKLGTFCVLDRCDNRYTAKTTTKLLVKNYLLFISCRVSQWPYKKAMPSMLGVAPKIISRSNFHVEEAEML